MKTLKSIFTYFLLNLMIPIAIGVFTSISLAKKRYREHLEEQLQNINKVKALGYDYVKGINLTGSELDSLEAGNFYEIKNPFFKRRYWVLVEPDTSDSPEK